GWRRRRLRYREAWTPHVGARGLNAKLRLPLRGGQDFLTQRHEASLKSVRAELVEAPFFFSTSQTKNGPSTSSGQTGLQRPSCLRVRNSALARLARPRVADDAVAQPPVFGGRRRHGREDRFPAAAEQRTARRDEGGKAHGGCFRFARRCPPAPLGSGPRHRW